jgi:probable H4MPT-linked C1 transfer pathway protein
MMSMRSFAIGDPAGPPIIGWDVGGVNLKAARLADGPLTTAIQPFELQRAPDRLSAALADIAARLHATPADLHAVTMTAELSQHFRTKRDGVAFVLDALAAALPGSVLHVWGTDGRFHTPDGARAEPLRAAASNWMATAAFVAQHAPDAILIDVGSTTTDIIPIVAGEVAALGRTDPERLSSGELVYTGALRTPVEAVVRRVPLGGGHASVSAEGFALTADLYLWLGNLPAEDYTVPTPDGRPATRAFAGERLARVVCGDRDTVTETDVDRLARAVAEAQIDDVAQGIRRVRERHPGLTTAVVTGLGDFIGVGAAARAGLRTVSLADGLGREAARAAPAAAVAHLLRRALGMTPA